MFRMFVIRHKNLLLAYLNICPHFALPLNHEPHSFMAEGHILCVQHFARFRPQDGLCIEGACEGSRLDAIPLYQDADGTLRIGNAELV